MDVADVGAVELGGLRAGGVCGEAAAWVWVWEDGEEDG